jgi:hypothetical protein
VAPTESRLYPVGFDIWDSKCSEYINPIVYVKGVAYATSYWSGLDVWIEDHSGLKMAFPFNVIIYNVQSSNHTLPPNTIPCISWNPAAWGIIFAIGFGSLWVIGVALKIWTAIRKALGIGTGHEILSNIPDISRLIPPAEVTSAKVSNFLDNVASGNLSSIVLDNPVSNLATDAFGRLESVVGQIGSGGGRGHTGITNVIEDVSKAPRLKLPTIKIPSVTLPKLPTFKLPPMPIIPR